MNHALRQNASANGDDWLSIDAVAELTGESVRTWSWRARREANIARDTNRESLAVKVSSGGRERWMLHRSLDDRLSGQRAALDVQAITSLRENYPQHFVDRGIERNRWLQRWLEACAKREDGLTDRSLAVRVVDEAEREEPAYRISVRTLYQWRKAHERNGVEGLIDKHTGPGSRSTRSGEAVDYFYSLYRTENELSVEECHRSTLEEAKRRGWDWPDTTAATRAWRKRHDDLAYSYLMRHGKTAYQHRYMTHLTMDWGAIAPGHMYVSDHKRCDFFVRWHKRVIRPWLTAVMDCRSRMIVGWHLGPKPHTEAIMRAFHMAFREYGLPAKMKIDNGKDFTCFQEWFIGGNRV